MLFRQQYRTQDTISNEEQSNYAILKREFDLNINIK